MRIGTGMAVVPQILWHESHLPLLPQEENVRHFKNIVEMALPVGGRMKRAREAPDGEGIPGRRQIRPQVWKICVQDDGVTTA